MKKILYIIYYPVKFILLVMATIVGVVAGLLGLLEDYLEL